MQGMWGHSVVRNPEQWQRSNWAAAAGLTNTAPSEGLGVLGFPLRHTQVDGEGAF